MQCRREDPSSGCLRSHRRSSIVAFISGGQIELVADGKRNNPVRLVHALTGWALI
jgi:hypothetical protein